jgi:hypothetical protein
MSDIKMSALPPIREHVITITSNGRSDSESVRPLITRERVATVDLAAAIPPTKRASASKFFTG